MLTRSRLPLLLLILLTTCAAAFADGTETDRDRDGLAGPVRRVRTETAKVLVREGKIVEGPRVVLETATYDVKGAKIDNAYFLAAGGALTGKEVYKYDDKGNIIEMTLFNADGSIMSRENYQYEFDAMGNWTKMVTSVAVIDNGRLTFEPTEVTYRSISYYLEETVAKKLQTGMPQPMPVAQTAAGNAAPQPVAVVKTAAPAPPPTVTNASGAKRTTSAPALPGAALNVAANVSLSAPTGASVADVSAAVGAVVKVEDGPPPPAPAPRAPVRPISGGVLNGRAESMPAPEYPETAKRVRASGVVSVEVVVDVTGRVIAAHAVSGHLTLRDAAERAAMRARFSPTLLSGQPVKVAGVINYNFAM
jgi:TonB family protein